jgi:hypothetical protein
MMDRPTIDLDTLVLAKGAHKGPDDGACIMEAVAWLAGEPWSDNPACVNPTLADFGRKLNDVLPDDLRQQLVPYVPRLCNTAGNGEATQRIGLMAADWLLLTYVPAFLRLCPATTDHAERIAALPPITSWDALEVATPPVRAARKDAAAALDAALDAAGAAALDAARDAARDAAAAAAWDAARAAARAAAWDAAWAAARAAAWAAALDAARDAARAAAWAAALDAARDAARDALAPTVRELQESAIALFGRMVDAAEDARRNGGM